MKQVKGFVKTCYSEALVSSTSTVAENEREDGSLISEEKEDAAPRESTYHGGLGLKFKFPGDPKKCVGESAARDLSSSQTSGFVKLPKSNFGRHISKVTYVALIFNTYMC